MRLVSFYAWFRSWFRSALHAAARIPAPDPYCAAAPGSLPRPFSRRIRHRTLPARPVLFFRQNLVAFEVGHATFDNHIGFKVQYTFDIAQRHIQQQTDTGRQGFQEPDVRSRTCQLDVAHALTTHFSLGHFNAALHRSHRGVSGACTYRTGTHNLYRPKDTGAEKAVTLRLERTVVNGFRLLTSPKDHERIMSGEARAILIASNSSVLVCAFRNFNKSFTDLLPSELAHSAAGR